MSIKLIFDTKRLTSRVSCCQVCQNAVLSSNVLISYDEMSPRTKFSRIKCRILKMSLIATSQVYWHDGVNNDQHLVWQTSLLANIGNYFVNIKMNWDRLRWVNRIIQVRKVCSINLAAFKTSIIIFLMFEKQLLTSNCFMTIKKYISNVFNAAKFIKMGFMNWKMGFTHPCL